VEGKYSKGGALAEGTTARSSIRELKDLEEGGETMKKEKQHGWKGKGIQRGRGGH